MTARLFPLALLAPGTFQMWPSGTLIGGGASLAGPGQTVDWSAGGWWMGRLGDIRVSKPDQHRTLRALLLHAAGGGEIVMPIIDNPQRPMVDPSLGPATARFNDGSTFYDGSVFQSGRIAFELAEDALEGDTVLKIRRTVGRPLLGGEYWSFDHPEAGPRAYPNGPPALSATVRLCRVYDWRDTDQDLMDPATWKWSANAHVNHVHWEWCLRHLPRVGAEGVGWVQGHGPGGVATPPPAICLEDWEGDHAPRLAERTAVADLCDERVALAAGGDEARYEQHGWWEIGTEDADVRSQYLNCYDGWMAEGGDGALIIKGGRYEAPPEGVVLTDRNLVEASWNRGAPDKDVYNIIKATFTSGAHGYSAQPADDWRDEDLIAEVGDEKPLPIDLGWVQSHGQARRLMKRMAPRVFADRHGDLAADLEGLNHIRRRYGRLERRRGPASMRAVDFELLGASIDLRGGRVPLNIVKADPNIDAWNPLTEEGLGPSLTERAPPIQVPMPEIVTITPVTVSVGDANGVRLRFVIEDPGRPGLSFAIRWRVAGAVSWTEESPQSPTPVTGDLQVDSGFVQSGDLEASISAWSGGARSDWTLEQDVSAEPDAAGVSPPSNLTASSPSDGELRVGYRDPSMPVAYCIVRTNTTATLTGATATPERPVGGVYTPQSVDLSRAAGSYYVWVTAYDGDDVPSADVGPVGPVVVS